jgi:predicted ATP-dependent serine protease
MGTFAEVEDLPIVYLGLPGVMHNKITRGDITMVAGAGGSAKGQTAIWIATALSLMGDRTVLITPEDDIETTVAPRLTAAGADKSKVFNLTTLDSGAPFLLHADGKTPGCIGALRQLVDREQIRCVIIDPILSCLGNGSIASNKGARALLAPLMAMAKETGIAIVLTHHTVLGSDGKPKAAGSKGLTDTLRLVYMARQDEYNPAIRVLSTLKTNGKPTDDVRFVLNEADNGFTYVSWLDNDEMILRRTAWRMQAEQAGRELGAKLTTASGELAGPVAPPQSVWSEDGDPDDGEAELNERVLAMVNKYK